jgi:sugar (pentulose or hexulose) kinase
MNERAARDILLAGRGCMGIELGSTRIKACLIDPDSAAVLAIGAHEWESSLIDGFWTYSLDQVRSGLQAAYASLAADCRQRYGAAPTSFAAVGVSAMMHGHMAFGASGDLLVPFRTWRNTTTADAAARLSAELGVNIPQRWSVAHLYQAALGAESHVPHIAHLTTLAGYVHELLTGENVLGAGDASGMFPLDAAGTDYDPAALQRVDALLAEHGVRTPLGNLLPAVRLAGEPAGNLTADGAALLDPTRTLRPGAPVCPPEGDAGTGMVATGALAPRTGNVSVGTSTFAMVVLERPLAHPKPEIDVVATPVGDPVAMVHCNNGASDLADWVALLREWAAAAGTPIEADAAFAALLDSVDGGAPDAGGLVCYNFAAGEPVVDAPGGQVLFTRAAASRLGLAEFARAQVFGIFAPLSVGMRMLADDGVRWERLFAHGGLFRTPGAAQRLLAAALGVPVTVARTASEGGAWGIALLAAFRAHGDGQGLDAFVQSRAFAADDTVTADPSDSDVAGYDAFLRRYRGGLDRARAASYSV